MDAIKPYPDAPAAPRAARHGHCLCAAVRLEVQIHPDRFGACHCSMCRRWSGAPMLSIDCGPSICVTGAEHVRLYASSAWAHRAFCIQCGSHLYYRAQADGHHYVPIGLLEGCEDLRLSRQLYIDAQPPYYARLSNCTHDLNTAQVLALYSANSQNRNSVA